MEVRRFQAWRCPYQQTPSNSILPKRANISESAKGTPEPSIRSHFRIFCLRRRRRTSLIPVLRMEPSDSGTQGPSNRYLLSAKWPM